MNLSIFIGNKHGRLTVVSAQRVNSRIWVDCLCDCGNSGKFNLSKLRNGHTKSCGCLHKEKMQEILTTHGLAKTRIHRIWQGMLDRCRRKNNSKYKDYGGRGISVCLEWHQFDTFHKWAIENGYSDTLTIERNNVNGDYHPDNCKWIPSADQHLNKTNTHYLEFRGLRMPLCEWAKKIICLIIL